MSEENKKKKAEPPKDRGILGSLYPCIHHVGLDAFAETVEDINPNFSHYSLGAVKPKKIIGVLKEAGRPGSIVAISFRLEDVGLEEIIKEYIEGVHKEKLDTKSSGIIHAFGGTVLGANLVRAMTGQKIKEDPYASKKKKKELKKIAEKYKDNPKFQNFFSFIADDNTSKEEVIEFAKHSRGHLRKETITAQDLIQRIEQARERGEVIIRAHIGLPEKIEATIEGIKKISQAKVLDIVSIAPDQDAQRYLGYILEGKKKPQDFPSAQGGCPIRSKEDLIKMWQAAQCGNYPLLRIYSGTDKLIEVGKVFDETIHICFPAVPIFWYNQMDGRGPIPIKEGIAEHQKVIKFWAKKGKPVEINDPHQWQLLKSSDTTYVLDHLLCAIIAKECGVKHYIMQMMFNLPDGISETNDLAKMQAAYGLIKILEDEFKDFKIIKETRAGLKGFPTNLETSKWYLGDSTKLQLYMDPHIIHSVTHTEPHHAAKPEDIITGCKIVREVVKRFKTGKKPINAWDDKAIKDRKLELKRNALYNLLHIALIGGYNGTYKDKTNLKSFDEFLKNEAEFKEVLLDLIDKSNYPGKKCNLVNADVLGLALEAGFLQAPRATVNDDKYKMVASCKTRIIDGGCETIEFNGEKVENEIDRVNKAMKYFKEQVKGIKVAYKGEVLFRGIPKEKVIEARNKLGIHKFENKKVLTVDFGSTYTKLSTFNTNNLEKITPPKYVQTTSEDLRICLAHGLGILNKCMTDDEIDERKLDQELKKEMEKYDIRLPSSSAKGGLKIVTVSAVKEESGKAAELAAFKAGGKILASYNGKLTKKQAQNIYQKDQPELILLTGGVDRGGNTKIVIHNAKKLAEHAYLAEYAEYGVPIVYAGTKDARKEIAHIFTKKNVHVRITENIMPEINEFNIDAVEDAISRLFREIIIKGKGFDKVQKYFNLGFVPTPAAALWAINLLASGYGEENPGIKDIIAFDVGGCTIDCFVVRFRKNPLYRDPDPSKRTIDQTPNLPLVTRRVEAKFGLSFNAENLMLVKRWKEGKTQAFINKEFKKIYPDYKGNDNSILSQFFDSRNKKEPINIAGYLKYLSGNPHFVPKTKEENTLNALIANELLKACTKNNCGSIEPMETYIFQRGINFLDMPCTVLLIGGTVYHKCQENTSDALRDLKIIAQGALFNPEEPHILRPHKDKVKILADADYLLTIIGGHYGKVDPKRALQIMKKHLKEIKL